MTHQLIRYEAACRALAECNSVDEVKDWGDRAAAMQAYQRMAGDKTLEVEAAEIRIRSERRLGELIAAQKATVGLNKGVRMAGATPGGRRGQPAVVDNDRRLKLADAGISKDQSARAQQLAAVPEEKFEAEMGQWREKVHTEGERVTARLIKAGAKEQARKPKPGRPAVSDPLPPLEAEVDCGPSKEEIYEAEQSLKDEAERVRLLLESDDALAAMTAKCVQQAALIRTLQSRIVGLTNEAAELGRLTKMWRGKFERATHATH